MQTKFTGDFVSLSDLKVNPGQVILPSNNSHRSALLTSEDLGVAVIQCLGVYDKVGFVNVELTA